MNPKTKELSAYTIARNCTDITDVTAGIDEMKEAMQRCEKAGMKIPAFYDTRLFRLKKKPAQLEYQESMNAIRKKINDRAQGRIAELSSKLAGHSLIEKYRVLPDMLFDENGNYHDRYQDEFCSRYDEYFDELIRLFYGK
jgi:hypothetical protein